MPEIDEPQPLNFNPVLQANTFTVVADIHHNQSDETTLPDDNSPFDIPLSVLPPNTSTVVAEICQDSLSNTRSCPVQSQSSTTTLSESEIHTNGNRKRKAENVAIQDQYRSFSKGSLYSSIVFMIY